jgi:hypothetical protein
MNKTFGFELCIVSARTTAPQTKKIRTKIVPTNFNKMPSQQSALPGSNCIPR